MARDRYMKIKKIELQNYCGYQNVTFDFTHNGEIKPLAMFFGPNGIGKSSILRAIALAAGSKTITADSQEVKDRIKNQLRKITYQQNYIPGASEAATKVNPLRIEATFNCDGDKRVIVTSEGVELDELPMSTGARKIDNAYFVDADHAMSMHRFAAPKDRETFLDIANAVYGFECELPDATAIDERLTPSQSISLNEPNNDFILHKNGTVVHFKRMSDGEKKIATFLRQLCRLNDDVASDIVLVDNIEMHIYMKRHAKLIDKIREHFPDKQFIVTTHSAVLVGTNEFPGYVDKEFLYDIEDYK
jgi:predicted ATP-binding protein involved in virulence